MPFVSSSQARAAFGGYLGPEMKQKAKTWAAETPDMSSLPEHVKKVSETAKRVTAIRKFTPKAPGP